MVIQLIQRFDLNDVIFWECDETKAGGWWWDGSNFPWEGITHRHFNKASIACADGHVEWLTREDYYVLGTRTPWKNRLWCTPFSTNGRNPHPNHLGN